MHTVQTTGEISRPVVRIVNSRLTQYVNYKAATRVIFTSGIIVTSRAVMKVINDKTPSQCLCLATTSPPIARFYSVDAIE